jgi:hypothetical protein
MCINQKEKRKDGREKLEGAKHQKRNRKEKKSKREFCQTNLV